MNHLPKVSFHAIDYTLIDDVDYTHVLFLRYALHRTKEKALEIIPTALKSKYSSIYDQAIIDIWKPKHIWETGWHKELASLGLPITTNGKKKK